MKEIEMKRSIVLTVCILAALCFLNGCTNNKADGHQPAPPEAGTAAGEVQLTELAENSDGLNAEELLRIRFAAIQPAAAEQAEEYYSDMTGSSVALRKDVIPSELIDALCKAIDDGTADGFVREHRTGTELTLEEMLAATEADAVYAQSAMSFRADIDNDGTEDIISHIWGGGTGGFASIVLFSGSSGFRQTASVADIYYGTSVLGWNGKNYLCVEEYDYSSKQWLGYKVYAFAEGNVVSITSVCKQIAGYTAEILRSSPSCPGFEQIMTSLSNDKMPAVLENNNGILCGTAEKTDADMTSFAADINNDGTDENYTKYMFYPSTAGMQQCCVWDIEGFDEESDPVRILTNRRENADAGLLYAFWVDKVEGDNVLNLYFHGDYGFELCAYKLSA